MRGSDGPGGFGQKWDWLSLLGAGLEEEEVVEKEEEELEEEEEEEVEEEEEMEEEEEEEMEEEEEKHETNLLNFSACLDFVIIF